MTSPLVYPFLPLLFQLRFKNHHRFPFFTPLPPTLFGMTSVMVTNMYCLFKTAFGIGEHQKNPAKIANLVRRDWEPLRTMAGPSPYEEACLEKLKSWLERVKSLDTEYPVATMECRWSRARWIARPIAILSTTKMVKGTTYITNM